MKKRLNRKLMQVINDFLEKVSFIRYRYLPCRFEDQSKCNSETRITRGLHVYIMTKNCIQKIAPSRKWVQECQKFVYSQHNASEPLYFSIMWFFRCIDRSFLILVGGGEVD